MNADVSNVLKKDRNLAGESRKQPECKYNPFRMLPAAEEVLQKATTKMIAGTWRNMEEQHEPSKMSLPMFVRMVTGQHTQITAPFRRKNRTLPNEALPENCHQSLSGRVRILLTRVSLKYPFFTAEVVNNFSSRESVFHALRASCHVPKLGMQRGEVNNKREKAERKTSIDRCRVKKSETFSFDFRE